MSLPVSPRSLAAATGVPVAGSSKPKRSVRVFSQLPDDDDSSSDDDLQRPAPDAAFEGIPQLRSAASHSFHPSMPKLSRTLTSGGPAAGMSRSDASSTAVAPPPVLDSGPGSYQEWKNKYGAAGQRRIAPAPTEQVDPDANYYRSTHRSDRPDMWEPDEDEDEPRATAVQPNGISEREVEVFRPVAPESLEGRERLEWQNMLASVLAGDVLQGESSRIGVDQSGDEVFRKKLGQDMWWQIRARMRGRSPDEEKRRVEERRNRVVDTVLEEVESFTASTTGSALDQVLHVLQKVSLIEALYPHQAAFRAAKPLYDSPAFQARLDGLTAWSTVVTALQAQLHILQKWTGSDDLDVTKPNTTKEKALVSKARYHPLDTKAKAHALASNDQAADDTTFLERVMKEDTIQKTFERRVFGDLHILIHNAKETVIQHSALFHQLQLPDFQYELVRLIGFPGQLIIEALKVRLDAATKLVEPSIILINDMIDNFRLSISLAVLIKKQYEDIVTSDPDKRWNIPPCLAQDYDETILRGIKTFFRLLHWKLKSGSKAIYFRETEILEDEWEFLYETAEAVEGGDLVVAEHFCSLTNKLMVRVCNYFDSQLHVPVPCPPPPLEGQEPEEEQELPDVGPDRRLMNGPEMLVWFGKILDAVKMRYRKLQRFARRLTQRFDNSAEYSFDDEDLDALILQLQDSGHFLVYTNSLESAGTYLIAEASLWERPEAIRKLLTRAFSIDNIDPAQRDSPQSVVEDVGDDDDLSQPAYMLLISPRQSFAWTGAVMTLDVKYIDFALDDNRIRLIGDGPSAQLNDCKDAFTNSLLDIQTGEPSVSVVCIVPQQAHLPGIQRELRKIAKSGQRLSESFLESPTHVQGVLHKTKGCQEMIENWYLFASDHGRRVGGHTDAIAQGRFGKLLMKLSINWVSFICDLCDPGDRRTFRWTVQALDFALRVTNGRNILNLEGQDFALLRRSVSALVSLLISHFDILGAKGTAEAKKEAERVAAMRRLQRLQENIDDDFLPRPPSPSGTKPVLVDRSIRLIREERLRLIGELEQARLGVSNDQHLIGQVLDEEVSEDRALVFLAASASNISMRWQQGAFIGGGANGNVYLGFNIDNGSVMAVKEIRVQDLNNSPALYKQIKDESDVMSMLSHPNVVEYIGIEVHRDRVYIFEEYCEGGSLANLLEHGRIEDEEVVQVYATQILSGLDYLHSKAVEHRDIKPDNILLSASCLKLVDFGAAKVIAKGNKTMARTRAAKARNGPTPEGPAVMNSLAGTPMYMAPEIIRSERRGRLGAADVWSMGCVLLEIVTGRKPWSNLDNEWAIMFHIGIATQHPPLPEPNQMSELGIDFIAQCLTLDPAERPTATELFHHPWLSHSLDQQDENVEYSDDFPLNEQVAQEDGTLNEGDVADEHL